MNKNAEFMELDGVKVKILDDNSCNSDYEKDKQHVFIIGSKGIPANYGGFETFVEKLTEYKASPDIIYHVSRMGKDNLSYEYNDAKCFNINVPDIGAAKAVYYDIVALNHCIKYCEKRPWIARPVFYVLACRIGPFIGHIKKKIQRVGGTLYVNPDGHEWKRAKWNAIIRKYWKVSEQLMVKHADLLICDSKNIEKYIQDDYKKYNPKTTFIAYGSDSKPSQLTDEDEVFTSWLKEKELSIKNYYLVVGRFVPENNFETMIREFMLSNSKKDFAIITTANERFLEELESKLHFRTDKRIKFVGTVYNQELLKKIRENAYGYFHGHEVGGTNPSLLEALGSTDLNLLLNVGFNKEVAEETALYWGKENMSLANLISEADQMQKRDIDKLGILAKKRISEHYSWEHIVELYENTFKEVD